MKKQHLLPLFWWILVLVPFLIWLLRYLNLDLWEDELTTLRYFVFVPFKTTLTYYPYPNNHIFANVLHQLYLKSTGMTLADIMDAPFKIRAVYLLYIPLLLGYGYKTGKMIGGQICGLLMPLILLTTIPYYNFCLQVRGYGWCILLVAMLLYYLLQYEKQPSKKSGFIILIISVLLLYTIPSNLYLILAIIGFYMLWAMGQMFFKKDEFSVVLKKNGQIILLLILSIALAVLLYVPVLKTLLNNPYVDSAGFLNTYTLFTTTPLVMMYFVSDRYVLFALAVLGLGIFLKKRTKVDPKKSKFVGLCLAMLSLPFFICFVHGGNAYQRIFTPLIPIFVLLMAFGLSQFFKKMQWSERTNWLALLVVFFYCQACFAYGIAKIEYRVVSDMDKGTINQNIYYNYYQVNFEPAKIAKAFLPIYQQTGWTPFLYHSYEEAMPEYVKKEGITYEWLHQIDSTFAKNDSIYIITAKNKELFDNLKMVYPNIQCTFKKDTSYFHKIMLCVENPVLK